MLCDNRLLSYTKVNLELQNQRLSWGEDDVTHKADMAASGDVAAH